MGETFTLNVLTNQNGVKKENLHENLEGDDLMFYHSLRPNLESLQMKPKLQTIHNILDYSKGQR
jgi:hypothetical protein